MLTLLFLAPFIGEIIGGATKLSFIFAFMPEVMVWGVGALMIREAVRRWKGGWLSVLALGLALSVAEEFIIQQTSLAPLPWLGDRIPYGRAAGVTWTYFFFMLGYESIWIVLLPIYLVELIFKDKRDQAWMGRRGWLTSIPVFLLGCYLAWFFWCRLARLQVFKVPDYDPPWQATATGWLAIFGLIALSFALRSSPEEAASRPAPPAWSLGLAAYLLGAPWYLLITLVFVPNPPAWPLALVLAVALAWAAGALTLIRALTLRQGWTLRHAWAASLGTLLVPMTGAFLGSSTWLPLDLYGQIFFDLSALLGMFLLRKRLAQA